MLEDALARFETEVEAIERAVVFLEIVDHRKALQIVLEATMFAHALVERVLAGMAEWRMAEIVGERNGFDQILVDPQVAGYGARDLRHFQTMREASAKQIALVVHEHLSLVFETPERGRVDDAVAIALKFGARVGRGFGMAPAARLRCMRCIRCQMGFECGEAGGYGKRLSGARTRSAGSSIQGF